MAKSFDEAIGLAKSPPTSVLIVGAGPAGLTAAATLARYNIPFRIIDKRAQ